MMRIRTYSGLDTIGGSKILVDAGEGDLILDFGLDFSSHGRYFESFLQPRGCHGAGDLWRLGLLPRVEGLYRDDCNSAGYIPAPASSARPVGFVLSHAHLDHCACAGFLGIDFPTICTPETAAILKSLQDTGADGMGAEWCYVRPRTPAKQDSRALAADAAQPLVGRKFFLTNEPSLELEKFWAAPPSTCGSKKLTAAPLAPAPSHLAGMSLRMHRVAHSVPGSAAAELESDKSRIAYTGDFRLHGRGSTESQRFMQALAGNPPDLLIVEGTRIGRPGDKHITERDVFANAMSICCRLAGRLIIVDFSGRHAERLLAFAAVAAETGRLLAISPKDAHLLGALVCVDDYFDIGHLPQIRILDLPSARAEGWCKDVKARHASLLCTSEDIRRYPGDFIVAAGYWDMPGLLDLPTQGGAYLHSSSQHYGPAGSLVAARLWEWLLALQLEPFGFHWSAKGATYPHGLNASGHLSESELRKWLLEIRPKKLLPLHTEHRGWFAELMRGEPCEVLLPSIGDEVAL